MPASLSRGQPTRLSAPLYIPLSRPARKGSAPETSGATAATRTSAACQPGAPVKEGFESAAARSPRGDRQRGAHCWTLASHSCRSWRFPATLLTTSAKRSRWPRFNPTGLLGHRAGRSSHPSAFSRNRDEDGDRRRPDTEDPAPTRPRGRSTGLRRESQDTLAHAVSHPSGLKLTLNRLMSFSRTMNLAGP